MLIVKAEIRDLKEILELQYLSYQSEAKLLNDFSIQPLTQTLDEVEKEFYRGIVLKAVGERGKIIGSVRCFDAGDTCYIGKLFVHPARRGQGIGSMLMQAIEEMCSEPRYELFTSAESLKNIRLYEGLGYVRFRESEAAPGRVMVYLEKRLKRKSI